MIIRFCIGGYKYCIGCYEEIILLKCQSLHIIIIMSYKINFTKLRFFVNTLQNLDFLNDYNIFDIFPNIFNMK